MATQFLAWCLRFFFTAIIAWLFVKKAAALLFFLFTTLTINLVLVVVYCSINILYHDIEKNMQERLPSCSTGRSPGKRALLTAVFPRLPSKALAKATREVADPSVAA